ncbi:hypothetical protein [Roseivivax sp.]
MSAAPGISGRAAALAARRAFRPAGFTTLDEIGLDLPLVSPYQLSCGSASGPVLVSYNFLDAPTARAHRDRLAREGYLPEMLFNRVLDRALALAGLTRAEVYLTHAFHALPATRSGAVPQRLVNDSFARITRHEIAGRPTLALGRAAAEACATARVPHTALPHPSARGRDIETKARAIAGALAQACPRRAA